MSVLVTGAAGFIGFHVSQALLARGDAVVAIDNLNDYYDVALKRARLAQLEELIAPAIAKDLDAADDDLRPQVVAASLTAAFNVLSERGEGPRGKPKTEDDVAAQIDPVITFLRGGLDALKEPRTARRR